jgi:nucleotide-binding universal stress UspA family protein
MMKTILVPTGKQEGMRAALDAALVLARRFDSYLEGFALRWSFTMFAGVDAAGVVPVEAYKRDSEDEERQAKQSFEAYMQEHKVPRASGAQGALSFGWLDDAPEGDNFVGSYGRVFDLIVMSKPDANSTGLHYTAIESGLFESGRPMLLAPAAAPSEIGSNVLVPWNGSTEQARATAFAMPLLQGAKRVTVLRVEGGNEVPGPSNEQMLRYMHRNGIAAEPLTVGLEGKTTGEAILKAADKLGCDLLVKGAYTQSRLRQIIFGGATRHVLEHAKLPVLLAH